MNKSQLKENEFFPAPGGSAGTLNVQPGYGTFSSPNVQQNPSHFEKNDRNKALGNKSNTSKNATDPGKLDRDINIIYSKKDVPSPDELVSAIQYEMGKQIKRDKHSAMQEVLKNLKKDPHFYSKLKMLNIDDESMVKNMSEARHPNDSVARPSVKTNIDATKEIFSEMSKGRDQKYVVNSGISEVMKEMWEKKKQRSAWKTSSK